MMDESNQSLFNILKISGPIFFFVVVFAVLFKVTALGLVKSALIAGGVAILDYFALTWVMKKAAK